MTALSVADSGVGGIWVWSTAGEVVAHWSVASTVADIVFAPHDAARLYSGGLIDGILTTWNVGIAASIDGRFAHRGGSTSQSIREAG